MIYDGAFIHTFPKYTTFSVYVMDFGKLTGIGYGGGGAAGWWWAAYGQTSYLCYSLLPSSTLAVDVVWFGSAFRADWDQRTHQGSAADGAG